MSRRNIHPEDARARIRKQGLTLTALAAKSGLHVSAISHCLRRCIPAANLAVAQHLGVRPAELWPSWFDADGGRLRSDPIGARPAPSPSSQKLDLPSDIGDAA
jgi:Ner family transcriptional regulator